jgi:hypothetical protein
MYNTPTCNVEKIKAYFQNEHTKTLSGLHRFREYNSKELHYKPYSSS